MRGKEEASVVIVGAALRRNFKLRATESSVLRIVIVGNDFEVFDGVFGRSDDSRSPPHSAGCTNAIDSDSVHRLLLTVAANGSANLRPKNAIVGARGSPVRLGAREVESAAAGALRAIAEDAGSQLRELQDVSS